MIFFLHKLVWTYHNKVCVKTIFVYRIKDLQWVNAHKQFGLEFEERGSLVWVFLRKRRRNKSYSVAVGVIGRSYGNASGKLVILGQVICAIGNGASVVSVSGGSHTLIECYTDYLGSWYTRGLRDYPSFVVRLLKRCLQRTASTVFGTPDTSSMTECIGTCLNGAKHRDWMQSRQSLQKAIETSVFSLLGLIDILSNIIGLWPLIFFHLKGTEKEDSGDGLVVCFFLQFFLHNCHCLLCLSCWEKSDGLVFLHRPVGQTEVQFVPFSPWNVLNFPSAAMIVQYFAIPHAFLYGDSRSKHVAILVGSPFPNRYGFPRVSV